MATGLALLLFAGFAAIAFATITSPLYGILLAAGAVLALIAIIDLRASRVVVESDAVRMVGLFKKERVAFSEIAEVKLDGGRTCLRLRSGEWKRLPEWLGASMSARHRIADRLSALRS